MGSAGSSRWAAFFACTLGMPNLLRHQEAVGGDALAGKDTRSIYRQQRRARTGHPPTIFCSHIPTAMPTRSMLLVLRRRSDAAVERRASHIAALIIASHVERTHTVAMVCRRAILYRYIRMLGQA